MNKIPCTFKYHQKLNVIVNCPFSCMILPIVIKCSLTAQNVFTCSACRHIPVLYTVAIVQIFFLLLVLTTIFSRCHTILLGFLFCTCIACLSLFSNLLIMTSQSVIVSFLSISASKGEV